MINRGGVTKKGRGRDFVGGGTGGFRIERQEKNQRFQGVAGGKTELVQAERKCLRVQTKGLKTRRSKSTSIGFTEVGKGSKKRVLN